MNEILLMSLEKRIEKIERDHCGDTKLCWCHEDLFLAFDRIKKLEEFKMASEEQVGLTHEWIGKLEEQVKSLKAEPVESETIKKTKTYWVNVNKK